MTAPVLALVDDLIFESKIAASAEALGVTLAVVRDPARVEARLAQTGARTLLVDLHVSGDPVAGIRAAKAVADPPRIVAWGSHVAADLAASARAAGADEVLPRSAFVTALPEILRGAGGTDRA